MRALAARCTVPDAVDQRHRVALARRRAPRAPGSATAAAVRASCRRPRAWRAPRRDRRARRPACASSASCADSGARSTSARTSSSDSPRAVGDAAHDLAELRVDQPLGGLAVRRGEAVLGERVDRVLVLAAGREARHDAELVQRAAQERRLGQHARSARRRPTAAGRSRAKARRQVVGAVARARTRRRPPRTRRCASRCRGSRRPRHAAPGSAPGRAARGRCAPSSADDPVVVLGALEAVEHVAQQRRAGAAAGPPADRTARTPRAAAPGRARPPCARARARATGSGPPTPNSTAADHGTADDGQDPSQQPFHVVSPLQSVVRQRRRRQVGDGPRRARGAQRLDACIRPSRRRATPRRWRAPRRRRAACRRSRSPGRRPRAHSERAAPRAAPMRSSSARSS